MKCTKCNQEIPEASKFCFHCGAKVVLQENSLTIPRINKRKMCPGCRSVFDAECVYCDQCGRLLQLKLIEGKELYRIRLASKYDGEPTIGIAKATGDLIIYDDRVEFKRMMGNAAASAFGVVGMHFAAKKTPPLEVYKMNEIVSIREGRYAGMMPTLIIQLNDGKIFSFCGMADGNAIHKAAMYIDEYRALNEI